MFHIENPQTLGATVKKKNQSLGRPVAFDLNTPALIEESEKRRIGIQKRKR
jgi:hypothetical protein